MVILQIDVDTPWRKPCGYAMYRHFFIIITIFFSFGTHANERFVLPHNRKFLLDFFFFLYSTKKFEKYYASVLFLNTHVWCRNLIFSYSINGLLFTWRAVNYTDIINIMNLKTARWCGDGAVNKKSIELFFLRFLKNIGHIFFFFFF